jgi:soluble lytic murein transglycosylase-like protein
MKVLPFLLLFFALPVNAVPAAYSHFASLHGIDARVLYSVARAESSRPGDSHPRPWPWAANINGTPHYCASRSELYQLLSQSLNAGIRNFDVGPMQINWKYNAHLFGGDLWSATDPYTNINAGAKHLSALLAAHHDNYSIAVRLYHTGSLNTEERLARGHGYAKRVAGYLKRSTNL